MHTAAAMCAHHPWQPALGACARCGDFICLRCSAEQPEGTGSPSCLSCAGRTSPIPLPWEGTGWFFVRWCKTIWLTVRAPSSAFGRLPDGKIWPGLTFAWCSAVGALAVTALLTGDWPLTNDRITATLFGLLGLPLYLVTTGWVHSVATRVLGARTSASHASRVLAYATGFSVVASWVRGLLVLGAPAVAPLAYVIVRWLDDAWTGYALFMAGVGPVMSLSRGKSAFAALVTLLPWLVLSLAASC